MIDIQLDRRDEATRARVLRSENRDAEREERTTATNVQHEAHATITAAEQTVHKAASFAGRFMSAILEAPVKMLGGLFDFLAGPTAPPTRREAEGMQQAAAEQQQEAAAVRDAAESEARLQELLRQIRRDDAEQRLARERGDDRDRDGGRERER